MTEVCAHADVPAARVCPGDLREPLEHPPRTSAPQTLAGVAPRTPSAGAFGRALVAVALGRLAGVDPGGGEARRRDRLGVTRVVLQQVDSRLPSILLFDCSGGSFRSPRPGREASVLADVALCIRCSRGAHRAWARETRKRRGDGARPRQLRSTRRSILGVRRETECVGARSRRAVCLQRARVQLRRAASAAFTRAPRDDMSSSTTTGHSTR